MNQKTDKLIPIEPSISEYGLHNTALPLGLTPNGKTETSELSKKFLKFIADKDTTDVNK